MKRIFILFICFFFQSAFCESLMVELSTLDNHTPIGSVTFKDTAYGLLIIPNLQSIRPGLHGFTVHEHPSCSHLGASAGGHYDPDNVALHLGPYQAGHLGDLPVIYVDQSGSAHQVTLAPRLEVKDIRNHSLLLYQGSDNYSDKPFLLGGGEEQIACAILPSEKKQ